MKRNLTLLFILLANVALLTHAAVPHHHHHSSLFSVCGSTGCPDCGTDRRHGSDPQENCPLGEALSSLKDLGNPEDRIGCPPASGPISILSGEPGLPPPAEARIARKPDTDQDIPELPRRKTVPRAPPVH